MAPLVVREPTEYFPSFVQKTDDHWLWQGSRKDGYGYLLIDGKRVKAHRFAFELWVGPIPDGKHVWHLCDEPLCVRPSHLSLTGDQRGRPRQRRREAAAHMTAVTA